MAVTYPQYKNWDTIRGGQYIFTDDGGSFSANIKSSTAFDYFPNDAVADDAIYFGIGASSDSYIFDDIILYIGTAFVADAVEFIWEYYNGSWAELTVTDGSNNFTITGQVTIAFTPPTDWTCVAVNSVTSRWVRCRIVSVTNTTEGGAQSTQKVKGGDPLAVVTGSGMTFEDIYDVLVTHGMATGNADAGIWDFSGVDIYLGDGSTGGTFTSSTNELVSCGQFWCQSDMTVTLGVLGYTSQGWNVGAAGPKINCGKWPWGTPRKAGETIYKFIDATKHSVYGGNICDRGSNSSLPNCACKAYDSEFTASNQINFSGAIHYRCSYRCSSIANSPTIMQDAIIVSASDLFRGSGTSQIDTIRVNMYSGNTVYGSSEMDRTIIDMDDRSEKSFSVRNPTSPNMNIYLKYRLYLTVQDSSQSAISGATVTILDSDGNEIDDSPLTTDINGTFTAPIIIYRHYSTDGDGNISNKVYDPHTITISKSGYQTKTLKLTMDRKREEVEVLEKVKDYNFSKRGRVISQ